MKNCHRPNCPRKARSHTGLCYLHSEMRMLERIRTGEHVRGDVPSEVVQEHLVRLAEAGWSYRRIAEASGISERSLHQVPNRSVVRGTTAARIFSVTPESVGTLDIEMGRVPAIGTARRLQALNAIGYTLAYLAPLTDMSWQHMSNITLGYVEFVHTFNAIRIAQVFRELQLKLPPPSRGATYARTRARKHGWVPPFMWDEDSIDDPNAEPQNPKTGKDDWYDDYQELKELGKDDHHIAERMGITRASLITRLRRLHATANLAQEHEQVRQDHEQMVREDWPEMASVR